MSEKTWMLDRMEEILRAKLPASVARSICMLNTFELSVFLRALESDETGHRPIVGHLGTDWSFNAKVERRPLVEYVTSYDLDEYRFVRRVGDESFWKVERKELGGAWEAYLEGPFVSPEEAANALVDRHYIEHEERRTV